MFQSAGLSRSNSKGLRGLRIGRLRIGAFEFGDFAPSDPLEARFRVKIRNLRGKRHRMHPSGASGTKFEAVLGPAQFQ
eukprot:12218099-Alexandrium_andersonii.AAC.1